MRTLAIGDIHGCLQALKALFDFIQPSKEDTIITLGDYIDRGPNSKGVLDLLKKLKQTHNVISLKGNHEALLEDARNSTADYHSWFVNGGASTLYSFRTKRLQGIASSYWQFIENCKLYHETDTHIFVHAGLNPKIPLEEQEEETLLWQRFRNSQPHISGKTMICGHTPQENGKPLVLDHAICIDTLPFDNGWLTCLDIDSNTFWQANQKGHIRKLSIEDLIMSQQHGV